MEFDRETVVDDGYSGLSQDEVSFILSDPSVTPIEIVQSQRRKCSRLIPMTGQPMMSQKQPPTISVRIKRVEQRASLCCGVHYPPEQFLIDNEATSIDTALDCRSTQTGNCSLNWWRWRYPREIIAENAGSGWL